MTMPTLKRERTVAELADLPDDGNRYEVLDGTLYVTPSPELRSSGGAAAAPSSHRRLPGAGAQRLRVQCSRGRDVFGTPRRAARPVRNAAARRQASEAVRGRPASHARGQGAVSECARADHVAKRTVYQRRVWGYSEWSISMRGQSSARWPPIRELRCSRIGSSGIRPALRGPGAWRSRTIFSGCWTNDLDAASCATSAVSISAPLGTQRR